MRLSTAMPITVGLVALMLLVAILGWVPRAGAVDGSEPVERPTRCIGAQATTGC
jgi:hypothetical protein